MNTIHRFFLPLLSSITSSARRGIAPSLRCALRLPLRLTLLALCMAIVAAAAFFMAAPASALPPLGSGALGTRAEAVFYVENDPAQMRVHSNAVSVRLAPVRALAFAHAMQVHVQAGQAFTIPLALRNQGNVAASYTLTMQGAPNGTLALVPDIEGNGRKHDSALALDLTQSHTVDYAQHHALLLTGVAPHDASVGSRYEIRIGAAGAPGMPGAAPAADTIVTLIVDAAPLPNVSLEASLHKLDTGDKTTLTARIANHARQELLADRDVTIDDRAAHATLLRYRIPAGLRFVGGNAPAGAETSELLFAQSGDPEFTYRTMQPEHVSEVAIALRTPLRPGQARQMTMTLQREENVAEETRESRAEAYDGSAMRPALSNLLVLEMAENGSPDLVPHISQSDTGHGDATTWIEIGIKNIGIGATEGRVRLQAELPFALRDSDLKTAGWQCAIRHAAAGSVLECGNPISLAAGADMPPLLINVPRDTAAGNLALGNACGVEKFINAVVSVPNEAENLRGNNRATAPLLCKNGAVVSGRAWIDASNDGIYRRGEETLPGWRAQLLKGGKVVAEALTGAEGQYRMTGILPDTGYRLRFLSPQGRVEAPPVQGIEAGASDLRANRDFLSGELAYGSLLSAREYPEQNLALLPTGVVFDSASGRPLAHAKVTLSGPQGFVPGEHLLGGDSHMIANTDEHGRYNFFLTPNAPAGVYRWQVAASGYEMPRVYDVLKLDAAVPAGHADRVWPARKVFDDTLPAVNDGDTEIRSNGYFAMDRVQGAKKVVNNHLALDALLSGGELSLQKSADRKSVEQIDFFHYTL
ncbi:MAG TPA: SdrD B-like domain-containing protein, partial [Herbaspirillum sp.]